MTRYFGYFRNAALTQVAYRGDYWLRVAGTALAVAIQYYLWRAVYGGVEGGVIRGYGMRDALTYAVLSGALSAFLLLEMNIVNRVRDGSIALSLAKPADWQLMIGSEALGTNLFTLLAVSFPVYLVALGLKLIRPPASGVHLAGFLVALALGYIVLFAVAYIAGLGSFWTHAGYGFVDAQATVIMFFSGSFVPLAMYPAWLQRIAAWLPFQGIYYLPLSIYLGKVTPSQLAPAIAGQAVWAVVLVAAGRLLWRGAIAHLTVQGG